LNWMENGWMDWIEWMWKVDVESGKWRGSGSHTCTSNQMAVLKQQHYF